MKRNLQVGILLLVSALVYGNTLANSFVMDDELYIFRNPQVTQPSLSALFQPNVASRVFRPVTFATLAGNWAVGVDHPFGYHLVNLLLHISVTLLLFLLLSELLASHSNGNVIAWAAALLFAVHPIHTEAVAWVVGRSELLAAGFLLAGWLLHLRDRNLLSVLCFALALLSKESAIAFLPLVLAGDYALGRWKSRIRYGALAALATLYLGVLWRVGGGHVGTASVSLLDNPLYQLPAVWRILNAIRIVWKYVALLVYPAKLSCDYSYNQIPIYGDLRHTLPAAVAAIAVFSAWIYAAYKRNAALIVAGALFFAGFAVTANILTPTGTVMGERLAYLPSAGFCLLIAALWGYLEFRNRTVAIFLLAAVTVAFGGRAVIRNRDWKDNFSLYRAAVRTVPGSAKMHAYLGGEYLHRKQFEAARREYQIALGIYPEFPDTIESLALLESWTGNNSEALRLMRSALDLSDRSNINYDYMTVNLAALLLQLGRTGEALTLLDREIAESPAYSRAWSNRAAAHYLRGESAAAGADADAALRLDRNNSQAQGILRKLAELRPIPIAP